MTDKLKKQLILNLPYLIFVYLFDKLCQGVRLAPGADASEKLLHIGQGFSAAFASLAPSFHLVDLCVGAAGAVLIRLVVYSKGKNAKKYRRGIEYGSARWGTPADIAPYMDKDFSQNVLLTQTERITMSSRPKEPKYARNKNILVCGGSGSGKTRFFVKPNLLQCHSSYVVTDPKGTILNEVGALLVFDEIQTGMGRTGRLFAMQKYGVTPDIVCLAKAFGGGMPLGAFVARHEVMDTLQENPALGHITTFGGHPVCCAAGLAALNYLVDNRVVETVETKGALYEMLLKDHPAVREIRRSGLLLAVELGESAKLYRIMELFREAGILSDWFLFCDTAFRISPPLTISEDEVRESAALIRSCLDRL